MKDKTISKYNNKKIMAYGRIWDSETELSFYEHIILLHGESGVIIQPVFTLQPEFTKSGKKRKAITYIADFEVNGVVYDVKGFLDHVFPIKRKMFDYVYPDKQLVAICKCPLKWQNTYGKWINLDDLAKERSKSKRAKTKSSKVL